MKVVISEPVLRGGYTDSKLRRSKDIDRRDPKFGVLTVHGSNFTKNKKNLKNLIFSVRRASQSWGGRFFLYKSIRENPLKSVVFEVVFDFKTTPRPGKSRFFKNVKRLIKYSP